METFSRAFVPNPFKQKAVRIGATRAVTSVMSTTVMAPEELVTFATALTKSNRNLEIMDCTAILHGYLELRGLEPGNDRYRKDVEAAAVRLRQATEEHRGVF